ncbi:hypothetical protein ASU28_05475 [Lactiplantibacillus paraplantarum]|uniref:MFS transporter n=1 Tax=Lactiplantibacillus paraplantarum TaxID=60520 RepID=UPI00051416F3|nr:MFS transporter [Lactiplantibacillus paraplantarum]ALO03838.1 hypothetical protein ASU28_05475 [Lactiplantibacillus paraplantarum]KGE76039.1 hypothetical protein HR47_03965 [Lactiplantibacillus paraplantarum]OAX74880.1 hypothetical protein A0U96_15090 [Lactiplantibacillus plantarum]RDG11274.1 MFS transporter [Lactiplantibacillus paraplantarum]
MKSNSLKTTFTFASLSLIFIFAASASPIPTYVQLQDRFKISNGTISMTAVCYFLGSIIALVIFSRLSDYIGRKFVAIITVMLSLVGLGLLATLNNGSMLLLARFIQGLSCGLGSSTLSILIIESGRDYSSGFVSAVAGSAILLGLAVGGLLSGLVAEVEPNFQSLTYYILMVVLVLMLLGLMHSAETVTTRHGAVKSLKPQLNLPDSIKKLIVPATGCFVATWALGGYFQAFSATVSKMVFNLNSPLVAAIVLVAYMAPNMFGSRISSSFSMVTGQLFGMSTFVLSALLMGVGILLKSFSLFLVMVIIASIMQGISYTTSMNGLLKPVLQTESTGVISVIYIISYAGAGIPSFVAGQLSRYLNFYQVTFAYIIFVSLVGVFVILNVLLQQHKISSSV